MAVHAILYTYLLIQLHKSDPETHENKRMHQIHGKMHFYLYLVTTSAALVWQILILAVFSPGVIEFWEVLATLLAIPLPQIVLAYIFDKL